MWCCCALGAKRWCQLCFLLRFKCVKCQEKCQNRLRQHSTQPIAYICERSILKANASKRKSKSSTLESNSESKIAIDERLHVWKCASTFRQTLSIACHQFILFQDRLSVVFEINQTISIDVHRTIISTKSFTASYQSATYSMAKHLLNKTLTSFHLILLSLSNSS